MELRAGCSFFADTSCVASADTIPLGQRALASARSDAVPANSAAAAPHADDDTWPRHGHDGPGTRLHGELPCVWCVYVQLDGPEWPTTILFIRSSVATPRQASSPAYGQSAYGKLHVSSASVRPSVGMLAVDGRNKCIVALTSSLWCHPALPGFNIAASSVTNLLPASAGHGWPAQQPPGQGDMVYGGAQPMRPPQVGWGLGSCLSGRPFDREPK